MDMTRLFEKALEAVLRLPPFFRQKSETARARLQARGPTTKFLNTRTALPKDFSLQKFFSCGCGSGKENATATNRYP